jgi:parallel beta-helix repeat protein
MFSGVIDIMNRKYIKISNMTVKNAVPPRSNGLNIFSILVHHGSSHIIIENMVTERSRGPGIHLSNAEHITVTGCDISGFSENGGFGGIYAGGCSNVVISGNTVYDTSMKNNQGWGGSGLYIRTCSDTAVTGNRIFRCRESGIQIGINTRLLIQNNLMYANRSGGIVFYPDTKKSTAMSGISIINNTVALNGFSGISYPMRPDSRGVENSDILILNNILCLNSGNQIIIETAFRRDITVGLNLAWGEGGRTVYSALLWKDPVFRNTSPGREDFRLKRGSPAIDAAETRHAPPGDIEGTERPKGRGADLGAYESF